MIKYEPMKNIAILIHKRRDDLDKFIKEFPQTYIYIDEETDLKNPFLKKIEYTSANIRNVIGNGIRHIYKDLPEHHIVLVNDVVTPKDIKSIIKEVEKGDAIVIAKNENTDLVSKKKLLGMKIITKLYNLVHRQHANNIMSNVQAIPACMVKHFIKLKGNTCNMLISQRFIIKDHNLEYKYMDIKSDVYTDLPGSIFGYLRCIIIICLVFIKFMLSSLSAFLVDYSLSILGYKIWSPLIVSFFANAAFSVPIFLLDVEIVSTAIARIVSSIYNYSVNKRVVFSASKSSSKLGTLCKYFTLVLIIWVFNTIILKMATTYLGIPFAIAKIIADIIMYFVSFTLQRDLVFRKRNK